MRRAITVVLAGLVVLFLGTTAIAGTPTPVTRMGDWVEVGNDVFMNMIASNTTRYRTTHNYDFENDVREITRSSNVTSSVNRFGSADILFNETRFGVDFRYKKNLTMRVLLEAESIFDGNLIDDTNNSGSGTEN